MKARSVIFGSLVASGLVATAIFIQLRLRPSPQSLVIADAHQAPFGLIYIAEANGYFTSEGLSISYRFHRSGKDALADVVAGNAQLATVFETPVVRQLLHGQRLGVVGTLHRSTKYTGLVVKQSKHDTLSNLKGKRVAVTKGTSAEFFLDLLLESSGIKKESVTKVNAPPSDIPHLFRSGQVDAVAAWGRALFDSQGVFTEEEATTYFSELHTETSMLVGNLDFVLKSGDVARRLLRALLKAETFYRNHRNESLEIVIRRLSHEPAEVVRWAWPRVELFVRLDHVLLHTLISEGQWIADEEMSTVPIPDMRAVLVDEYLDAVDPLAVTLSDR